MAGDDFDYDDDNDNDDNDGSFMGSTNFVPKMWLPDIQIYMCKQFR